MKQVFKHGIGSVLGFIGLLGLIAGGITAIVQMRVSNIAAGLLIVGLLAVLGYVVIHFKTLQAQFAKRSIKYGANVTVMILIVFGIVVLVEAISSQHNVQLDLTENHRFTLSDQTRKVLDALENEVRVLAFFSIDQANRQILEDLLAQYANRSSNISYEFIDPDKNPGRAQNYDIRSYGTIVLEQGDRQEKILEATEEALTNALVKVTRTGKKVVYFLTGHGEHQLDDMGEAGYTQAKSAIEATNYEVKELLLMQQAAVPEDATVLIAAGPQKDLVPAEVDALTAYLDQGGKLLLLLDPQQAPGMTAFLEDYGVIPGDNMIIDPFSRVFGAGYDMPVASEYQPHPITDKFNIATFFPVARSVQLADPLPAGVSGQTLASSSPESWAETSQAELQRGEVEFTQDEDLPGPAPLAAVLTLDADAPATDAEQTDDAATPPQPATARLVVFGDSDFASNTYLGLSGNADLFLNTVSWLAEEQDLIAIRAKDPQVVPLVLTAVQGRLAFFLAVVLLPLLVITTGVTVYINRRQATR
jgi:ABC-type uncharacterized transport system involved in gliding motility auxiliary subunit